MLHSMRALAGACGLLLLSAHAAEPAEETFGWHGQATWVWQAKPGFRSPYAGPNSLDAAREKSYSFTSTAALGARPWRGGELYFNAELVQGVALSGLVGLGGLSNGELQKTAGSNPVLYAARGFLRQTWDLGGESTGSESQAVESGFNQLAGSQAGRRIVLSLGKLAASDLFDANAYAHDARTGFLNWALLTHGHYDFAADSRGYSNGAALEWFHDDWTLRGGRFAVPVESNGLALDHRLDRRYGDQLELEHRHRWAGRAGALRLLLFRNIERMARYDEALAAAGDAPPELDGVRRVQSKRGWGMAAEQALSDSLGGFLRLGRHDGATEPYSFASIDDAASLGLVLRGSAWQRGDDQLGLALASNGLSAAHRRFLAAGGADFFIGDGRLNYGRETIFEAFYSAALGKGLKLSLDAQHIAHPAYNRDRGPVRLFALRLHVEL
jgi:hypothetical protein